jgi:hypothetical protein
VVEELNDGMLLHTLKASKEEWRKLRTYMSTRNKLEIEENILTNTTPLFGYPTILYENQEDKGASDSVTNTQHLAKVLTSLILPNDENQYSVHQILDSLENEELRQSQLYVPSSSLRL